MKAATEQGVAFGAWVSQAMSATFGKKGSEPRREKGMYEAIKKNDSNKIEIYLKKKLKQELLFCMVPQRSLFLTVMHILKKAKIKQKGGILRRSRTSTMSWPVPHYSCQSGFFSDVFPFELECTPNRTKAFNYQ